MKIFAHIIITILIFLPNVGMGQYNFALSFGYYSDDNIYRSTEPVQDNLTNYRLRASYDFKDTGFRIFDNFSILNYQNDDYRNFLSNTVGLTEKIDFNEERLSYLYFGGNWNIRANQNDFNYYDYSQLNGFANAQVFTKLVLIKTGYSYRWREYANWPELSNRIHYTFLQLNKSLPTRTTIILESALGSKSFTGTDTLTTTVTTGMGHGRRAGTTDTITTATEKTINTSQLNFTVRLTQSVLENIGIYIQYFNQQSIDDKTAFTNFSDYYEDAELFDDPYTYESNEFSSQLTWMLPQLSKLVINGGYSNKSYIREIAFADKNDSTGTGDLRSDEQKYLNVNLSKTFKIKQEWINSIKFNLNFSYINNESNSYWYNYERKAFGGSIELNL